MFGWTLEELSLLGLKGYSHLLGLDRAAAPQADAG